MDEQTKDDATEQIRLIEHELAECRDQARRAAFDLGERVKELTCLYAVASLSQLSGRPLREVMQGVVESLVPAYQFPSVTCARITLEDQAYTSSNFRESRWRQAAELLRDNQTVGAVEVFYREERPAADEGPFLREERRLIDTVARIASQHLRIRSEHNALKLREREFRSLAENSTDIISRFDRALRRTYTNPAIERALSLPPSALLGKANREIGMPEDMADFWDKHLKRVFTTGREQTVELTWPTIKGDRIYESRLVPEWAPDGSIETVLAITRDITEHKRVQQALRESEERYRRQATELETIYQRAPIGLAVIDTQLRYLRVNERLAEINGLPAAMHIGKTISEVIPALTDFAESIGRRVIETSEPVLNIEFRGETPAKPGVEGIWNEHWLPLKDSRGKIWGINVVVEEITERKRAEEALRESERKYRTLVENLNEGIWLIDQEEKTSFVNKRMAELLGYEPEEMLGKHLFDFMGAQAVHDSQQNLARGRSGVRTEYELRFRRKNGEPIWTNVVTAPLFDKQGNYRGALAGVTDITARKLTEAALHTRQQEFEALAEKAPDIIARVDRTSRCNYINRAVERFSNRPRESFLGKAIAELDFTPRDRILRERAVQQVFDSGQEQTLEHEYLSPTGLMFFHSRLVPEYGSDGKVASVLVVDRDITELKRAQFALERLTLEDPVTGIANRRHMEQFVEREWAREVRHRHPVAVVMADIDHFKTYNDRYGHQKGDECLQQVAQALKMHLHRPTDFLVRYGGEEFVVILIETNLSAAARLAEAMRKAIVDRALPHEASSVAPMVTVSLGVAAGPAHLITFAELLSTADEALYRAKRKGRNRVEVGQPMVSRI